ncbi:MAG: hypothetical protein QW404_00365 [Candidatus Nanoarchaeia archaeon]
MQLNIEEILLNIKKTEDLTPIIEELKLDTKFKPVKETAEKSITIIQKETSKFKRIKETKQRIKTLDSSLFKMLYMRSEDLNRVNDLIGFLFLVDNLDECYKLFDEMMEEGMKPYFRIFDTLDKKISYKSLDINIRIKGECFQAQIRTPDIEKNICKDTSAKKATKKEG